MFCAYASSLFCYFFEDFDILEFLAWREDDVNMKISITDVTIPYNKDISSFT